MNFTQLVNEVTRPVNGTCLDHIYSNHPQRILNISTLNCGLSDHIPIFAVRKYNNERASCSMQKNQNIRYRDMKQFDENRFKEALSQAPWDTVFVFDEIDDMLDSWESLFNSVLDENCPWREKRVKRAAQAPWMTSSVLKQLHLRDNCLKTARRSNNADDWSNYRAARNKAVAMIRSAKRKFFCNAFEENKGNSRGIWKTIRTLTGSGKNRRDINSINIGEAVIDDKKLMAQHFNAHFSSIADRLRSTLPQVPSDPSKLQDFVRSRKSPDTSYVIPSITSAQVLTFLHKLSPRKAAGIDKISSQLLRIAAPVVARLINFSFSSGSFPSRWKTAKVSPLYKNGDSRDVQNFRPISVLPVLSKVIERHVHGRSRSSSG